MDFQEADRRYDELKRQYDSGAISAEAFTTALTDLMVQDAQGRWWSRSPATGEWNYHDGTRWVPATPPAAPPPAMPPAMPLPAAQEPPTAPDPAAMPDSPASLEPAAVWQPPVSEPAPPAAPASPYAMPPSDVPVPVAAAPAAAAVSPKQNRDTFAIASVVLGGIGLLAWLLPLCGFPIGIAGVVTGALGMQSLTKRNLAIIGIVLSVFALGLSALNAVCGAALMLQNLQ